ncbi:PepSY-associated TM helix domain-containing protein [Parahaliea aestuarii]|uniref:PepSY domain-containing protein n=1 Tax=Parahaliea aestuarii TaxID=1852021 RepID=A0A5C9A0W5_9GAMM|nr:PepSY-associated TM helix domain-containing protein [Parahaliea aestuarii]TXS94398.1 PepSY domain-containing protein [Parahaliea aestuarii]
MRSDIIKLYKDVHTWTGIVSGLLLFIAFYAGAITMFEAPLQRWASPPAPFGELTPLEDSQQLIDRVLADYPDARRGYQIVFQPSAQFPARMSWQLPNPEAHDHDPPEFMHANLTADNKLIVAGSEASPVSQLVDDLHRQVGLMLPHEIAMPIMGSVALLYGVALVSGVIVLLPTLVQDLFAFRLGKNLKRLWLDFHNLLGVFSLPFHLVMALTSVIFAFHDQIYDAQEALVYRGENAFIQTARDASASPASGDKLSPALIAARLQEQQPEFEPHRMIVNDAAQRGPSLVVFGSNPRYGNRSPDGGVVGLDPYTGDIVATDYMPGMQSGWGATITSFFTLHFGSYGGNTVRWAYFFLGLGGAALFYTGNLLWLETRRKKQKKSTAAQAVEQRRSARILGPLTVGVSLGCIAGISVSIAAAKVLPALVADIGHWHTSIYYLVFVAFIGWAFLRGTALGAVDLLRAAALATGLIPLISLAALLAPGFGWNYSDGSGLVDVVASLGAIILALLGRRTAQRIRRAPHDSLWYIAPAAPLAPAEPGKLERT